GAAAAAAGAERDGGGEDGLSDLHHEIKAFEKYVSLTQAEVEAREGLVASIQLSAQDALGHGASARAFGSYGGLLAHGAGRRDERCFSIFLSDVDISVVPPPDPDALPSPARRILLPAGPSRAGFLDLSQEPDDRFEAGSSSSSSEASSSSSESESESGSGSESESASESDSAAAALARSSPRTLPPAAATAAAAIYVASSGSEAEHVDEGPSPSRPLPPSPSGRPRTVNYTAGSLPTPGPSKALPVTSAANDRAGRGGDQGSSIPAGGDGVGGSGCSRESRPGNNEGGGGGGRQAEGEAVGGAVGKESTQNDTVAAAGAAGAVAATSTETTEALGFYLDCRPDPELLKLARGGEKAAAAAAPSAEAEQALIARPGESTLAAAGDGGGPDAAAHRGTQVPGTPSAAAGVAAAAIAPGTSERSSDSAAATRRPKVEPVSFVESLPPAKGKGKKRPLSPSRTPSSEGARSEIEGCVGGTVGRGARVASAVAAGADERGSGSDSPKGGSGDSCDDGRLRAVFRPHGGGWSFVKGKGKKKRGQDDEEEEEEDGADDKRMPAAPRDGKSATAPSVASASAAAAASATAATTAAAAAAGAAAAGAGAAARATAVAASFESSDVARARLAQDLRAESERTARLTATANRPASKVASTCGSSDADESMALPPLLPLPSPATSAAGDGSGTLGGGGGSPAVGDDGDGNGERAANTEEARHAEGLMALVREQERRNRGGSLPPAFLSAP
ncbi:unnamed protein product, partial [Hapterophycus canaliculatus]